jgi:hypothetical protein
MSGKNIENELRAINHASVHHFLNIALLRSREIVVEKQQVSISGCSRASDFFQLAFSYERGRVRLIAMLQHFADNFRTRTDREVAQFVERLFRTEGWLGTRTRRCRSIASSLYTARESLVSTRWTVINSDQERTFLAHTRRQGATISSWLQETGGLSRTTRLILSSQDAQFRTAQSHLSFRARGGG